MTAANKTNNLSTSQLQTCQLKKETSGGYCGGVPPLPIPNREVKPTCADGTAMQCGRVGSRLLSAGAPRIQCPRGSFFCACLCLLLCTLMFSRCSSCERKDHPMSESLAICVKLHAVLTQIGV